MEVGRVSESEGAARTCTCGQAADGNMGPEAAGYVPWRHSCMLFDSTRQLHSCSRIQQWHSGLQRKQLNAVRVRVNTHVRAIQAMVRALPHARRPRSSAGCPRSSGDHQHLRLLREVADNL